MHFSWSTQYIHVFRSWLVSVNAFELTDMPVLAEGIVTLPASLLACYCVSSTWTIFRQSKRKKSVVYICFPPKIKVREFYRAASRHFDCITYILSPQISFNFYYLTFQTITGIPFDGYFHWRIRPFSLLMHPKNALRLKNRPPLLAAMNTCFMAPKTWIET